ncbi:hypothetical protein SAMN05192533_103346 [Mesobacillus persicus]|uniref:Uncharacterized protein n=1 Tax=Mesobacillus persicus TaxID=930146 RepID=A0A1H7ZBM4_9BACI|nr:hypothetical protein [Mesobacillus persicus]SEM55631.1 hypothetical protein SAMN05192533_103346 [Mesobacillus persicus]
MQVYFRYRFKQYILVAIAFLFGLLLAEMMVDEPDYPFGIFCFVVSFGVAETLRYKKWARKNRDSSSASS